MKRLLTYLSIGFVFGFFSWSTNASAQEKKPPVATEKPAGLRVMNGGHSWSTENSAPLCQAAGITGHMKLNKQGLNSGRIEDLTPLLEKGEIDVYVWQHSGVGPESPKFLPTLVELGPKHNPNFRVLMQMPWLVHDGRQGVKSPEEYETTDLAEYQTKMEKYRKQQEAYADEVNAKAGKRVVFLVPLGDGMLEVRKMIVAGKFPGVTKQRNSVLAGDHMPHQGLLGIRLGAYMHFAALYRMSPEGLKFPGKDGDGLTDAQRAILQKLAWDMVSKYYYAGIAKSPAIGQAPPAGVRISIDGNSWSVWPSLLLPMAKEAGIEGQIDGSKDAKQRLEKGELDVVAYGHNGGSSTEINGRVTKTVELGLQHNPNFRMYYQASWVGEGTTGRVIKTKDDYDTTKIDDLQAATDRLRKGHEDVADGLNKTHGKRVVFVVPLGDAVVKLRALIVAGKFPGVKRQSEIFGDAMPHPGALVAWLSAYCHFSAIYRIPPPAPAPLPEGADQSKKDAYTQQEILRQIAWETVSKYPYAGVLAVNNPGRTEEKKDTRNTRMLFLGNSITLHPPAEGMSGSWGMAASSAEKDYVHIVLNAIEKRNGKKPESKVVNLADFERGFEQYDLAAKLKGEIEFQADTVILAIGENVPDLKTDEAKLKFRDSVSRMLKLLRADRRCTIYVRSCFWPNAAKDSALKEACTAAGGVFVDISALSKDEKNYARSERKFANTGIAIHPGDQGMSAIAERIVAAIKEHDGAKMESKPAPASVPEALKGWKETQDLPDDTVVADYNAYIEKLPKAERPGVANVLYYVDGNGQSGVAVLVNVERVEWTYFVTYDKQNKRTAVKKFVSGK